MITTQLTRPTTAAPSRPDIVPATPARRVALCSVPVTAAAVPSLRRFTRDAARRWGVAAEARDTLSLVVTELVTNVLLHSSSPEVLVMIAFDGSEVTVEVKDAGRWQPRLSPRLAAEDADAECGRGLDLVRHCTSRLLAFLSGTGSRVVACLPAAPATA
ncbi:ATP-binding protein [Kitasatospora purpeofusca]|uniref:ATP-binding protein n=1 Tax=Kitasatospora purpeofusca TaxID=67352 RepID=UPI00382E66FE